MTSIVTILLVILAITSEARAQVSLSADHPLEVAREELFRSLEGSSLLGEASIEDEFEDGLLGHITSGRVGLRPVLAMVPGGPERFEGNGDFKPPGFALVARAEGRTLVAVTRPGAKAGPGDHVVLQRLLVSDLLKGQRFSLTVYKDQAFDENTFSFLGVGARLLARPAMKLFGWNLRLQVFGSYHPEYGGTGYVTISGSHPGLPRVFTDPID